HLREPLRRAKTRAVNEYSFISASPTATREQRTEARAKTAPAEPLARLGSALRELRARRGWTLAEVGRRTGVPVPTLSKIENGKLSPSYRKLALISQGLGMDIAELLAEGERETTARPGVLGRRSVTRAGERGAGGPLYPAADLLNKRITPQIAEIHARSL